MDAGGDGASACAGGGGQLKGELMELITGGQLMNLFSGIERLNRFTDPPPVMPPWWRVWQIRRFRREYAEWRQRYLAPPPILSPRVRKRRPVVQSVHATTGLRREERMPRRARAT